MRSFRASIRRSSIVSATVLAIAGGVLISSPNAFAATALPAPAGLTVTRQGTDLSTLNIGWKPVANVARYTVTVFDGTNQNVYTVPATQTTWTYAGSGVCTRYSVQVVAVDNNNVSSNVARATVTPLAPGGITNLAVSRTQTGDTAEVRWSPPATVSSHAPVSDYGVTVKALATGDIVAQRTSPDTTESISGLDPARVYVAEISPTNTYGTCATSKVLVRSSQPSQPTGLTVIRDTNDQQIVNVSWNRPTWTGYGPLTKMQIGVRNPAQANPTWIDVPADTTSVAVKLPNSSKWSIWVRGVNGTNYGEISKEYFLNKPGGTGTPVIDPKIVINETAGVVKVTFDSPVGSHVTYPNMSVAIAPTSTDAGFTEKQTARNQAQTFTFDKVPCGAYTVTVTGYGTGASAELGRKMINQCTTPVPANQWKLVYGKATINNNTVDMTHGNEARVISTVPRTNPDMVYSTNATLVSGSGYGIWTRATVVNGAAVSGYTFQYDPGYENVNKTFGKALLLRVWQDGKECGTPIARVQWPAGLDVNATHKVTVVTKGDALYATIDGIKMFDVPSLKAALATSKCNMAEPTGSQVGFRTWSTTGKATFANTTIN